MDLLLVALGCIIASLLGAWLMIDNTKKQMSQKWERAEDEICKKVNETVAGLNETREKIAKVSDTAQQMKSNLTTALDNSGEARETADKVAVVANNAVDSALKAEDSANEARKLVVELTGEITELKAGIEKLEQAAKKAAEETMVTEEPKPEPATEAEYDTIHFRRRQ